MLNTRVEKISLLVFEKFFFGQNSSEINEKKKISGQCSSFFFLHEQNGFCGILENYSSFCTKEKSCN